MQFYKPCQTNQLLIVFSPNLSVEHIIQNLKISKSAATDIRKSLNEYTFNLNPSSPNPRRRQKLKLDFYF